MTEHPELTHTTMYNSTSPEKASLFYGTRDIWEPPPLQYSGIPPHHPLRQ